MGGRIFIGVGGLSNFMIAPNITHWQLCIFTCRPRHGGRGGGRVEVGFPGGWTWAPSAYCTKLWAANDKRPWEFSCFHKWEL